MPKLSLIVEIDEDLTKISKVKKARLNFQKVNESMNLTTSVAK